MPKVFTRRTILWPTWFGWTLLLASGIGVVGCIAWGAERFLAAPNRVAADVLILEAWTKDEGAEAAAIEFKAHPGQYKYVVSTGGLTGEHWSRKRWREDEIGERVMRNFGVPPAVIIKAPAPEVEAHRSFVAAVTARDALAARGIHPQAINVITRGAHAKRSRLIFTRVFGGSVQVGVVGWLPEGFDTTPWWKSSGRATDVLKESVGYLYELLLHSGRPFSRVGIPERAANKPSNAGS